MLSELPGGADPGEDLVRCVPDTEEREDFADERPADRELVLRRQPRHHGVVGATPGREGVAGVGG